MRISFRVIPGSKQNKIIGLSQGINGHQIKIQVTAAPEAGKANTAVLKLLAKHWHVPKSCLKIVRGETARDKIIDVDDDYEHIQNWLDNLGYKP